MNDLCPLASLPPLVQRSEADPYKTTFRDLSLHLPQSGDVFWSLAGRQQEPMERSLFLNIRSDHTRLCITHPE